MYLVFKDFFNIQKRIHTGTDRRSHHYNPQYVPGSTEYFVRNVRWALPILKIYEYRVPGKIMGRVSSTIPVVGFSINEVLARSLRFPQAVSTTLAHPGGHVFSPSSCQEYRVIDAHVLAVPTRNSTGACVGGQLI